MYKVGPTVANALPNSLLPQPVRSFYPSETVVALSLFLAHGSGQLLSLSLQRPPVTAPSCAWFGHSLPQSAPENTSYSLWFQCLHCPDLFWAMPGLLNIMVSALVPPGQWLETETKEKPEKKKITHNISIYS